MSAKIIDSVDTNKKPMAVLQQNKKKSKPLLIKKLSVETDDDDQNDHEEFKTVSIASPEHARKIISTDKIQKLKEKNQRKDGIQNTSPKDNECNLIVNYIPDNMSESHLRAIFEECGTVIRTKIVLHNATRIRLGYGFVIMSTKEQGANAIAKLNGLPTGDKPLKVKYARAPSKTDGEQQTNLYIVNLPHDFEETNVSELVGEYGPIEEVRVLKSPKNNVSRGIAFARMSKREDAINAIAALNGKTVGNGSTPLTVKFAESAQQRLERRMLNQRYSPQQKNHSLGMSYSDPQQYRFNVRDMPHLASPQSMPMEGRYMLRQEAKSYPQGQMYSPQQNYQVPQYMWQQQQQGFVHPTNAHLHSSSTMSTPDSRHSPLLQAMSPHKSPRSMGHSPAHAYEQGGYIFSLSQPQQQYQKTAVPQVQQQVMESYNMQYATQLMQQMQLSEQMQYQARVNQQNPHNIYDTMQLQQQNMSMETETQKATVFVDHLPVNATENDIWKLFQPHGVIVKIEQPRKKKFTNKLYTTVTMSTEREAMDSVEHLNQSMILGQKIKVVKWKSAVN